jgi:DNA-binding beta-propeller fold protein YncE
MMSKWRTPLAAALLLMTASSQQTVQAPKFEVDPLWPKPLPTHWLLGSAVGLAVDSRDHVWVVNLPNSFTARTEIGAEVTPPLGDCCLPSPNVLEFDADGTLVGHWGGPGQGYTWPSSNHGIAVAPNGNLWIGGAGPRDTQILEFTTAGKFVRALGTEAPPIPAPPVAAPDTAYAGVSRGGVTVPPARGGGGGRGRGRGAVIPPLPANSASTDAFGGAARASFDTKTGEAFVADGYRNHRIAVVDVASGAIKRTWGAYGKPATDSQSVTPSATSAQFAAVTCAELSTDGLVYVCDRTNDRLQVFDKTGKFVKEASIAPSTKGAGSVWDVTFSRDPQQKFLYVADGQNMKVHILDRQTLNELSSVGEGGRQPGEFFAVHSVATDSKGNLYTVESLEGKRLQKFVFKGVTSVPRNQGTTWPKGGK